jgi:hypothetical protein
MICVTIDSMQGYIKANMPEKAKKYQNIGE